MSAHITSNPLQNVTFAHRCIRFAINSTLHHAVQLSTVSAIFREAMFDFGAISWNLDYHFDRFAVVRQDLMDYTSKNKDRLGMSSGDMLELIENHDDTGASFPFRSTPHDINDVAGTVVRTFCKYPPRLKSAAFHLCRKGAFFDLYQLLALILRSAANKLSEAELHAFYSSEGGSSEFQESLLHRALLNRSKNAEFFVQLIIDEALKVSLPSLMKEDVVITDTNILFNNCLICSLLRVAPTLEDCIRHNTRIDILPMVRAMLFLPNPSSGILSSASMVGPQVIYKMRKFVNRWIVSGQNTNLLDVSLAARYDLDVTKIVMREMGLLPWDINNNNSSPTEDFVPARASPELFNEFKTSLAPRLVNILSGQGKLKGIELILKVIQEGNKNILNDDDDNNNNEKDKANCTMIITQEDADTLFTHLRNNMGAIHYAVCCGPRSVAILKLLLQNGADPNFRALDSLKHNDAAFDAALAREIRNAKKEKSQAQQLTTTTTTTSSSNTFNDEVFYGAGLDEGAAPTSMTILHGIVSKTFGLSSRNVPMAKRLELVKTVLEFTRWDDIAEKNRKTKGNDAANSFPKTLEEYLSSAIDACGKSVLDYAKLTLKHECENDQEKEIAKQIVDLLLPKGK